MGEVSKLDAAAIFGYRAALLTALVCLMLAVVLGAFTSFVGTASCLYACAWALVLILMFLSMAFAG